MSERLQATEKKPSDSVRWQDHPTEEMAECSTICVFWRRTPSVWPPLALWQQLSPQMMLGDVGADRPQCRCRPWCLCRGEGIAVKGSHIRPCSSHPASSSDASWPAYWTFKWRTWKAEFNLLSTSLYPIKNVFLLQLHIWDQRVHCTSLGSHHFLCPACALSSCNGRLSLMDDWCTSPPETPWGDETQKVGLSHSLIED